MVVKNVAALGIPAPNLLLLWLAALERNDFGGDITIELLKADGAGIMGLFAVLAFRGGMNFINLALLLEKLPDSVLLPL